MSAQTTPGSPLVTSGTPPVVAQVIDESVFIDHGLEGVVFLTHEGVAPDDRTTQ